MTPERSDRDLVLAFKAGERAAYDEMYSRYFPRVYGVCSRILNNRQDAEEASQETFLRAYQALHRFNGRYQLGAWLARIAANASVDQLRNKSRAPVVGLPGDSDLSDSEENPEKLVIGDHPRLTAAIGDVKPLHAQALALRTLEGLSHQEIAERLSMTPAQVKALLHRARSSLRKAWDRAEGWVLAPVLSIRALVADRTNTEAGSPLLSAGGALSPLLAERAAAAALVVAVALGGFPSPVQVSAPSPSATGTRPISRGSAVARPERAVHDAPAVAARQAKADEAPAQLTEELPRLIEDTLKGHSQLSTEQQKKDDSDEDETPSEVSSTAANAINEAQRLLPQGGPGFDSPDL